MKKNILIALGAILVAAAASDFVCAYDGSRDFNANVKELERQKGSGFGPMCSQTGASGNYYMKRCSGCNGSMGHYAMDKVAYCPAQ